MSAVCLECGAPRSATRSLFCSTTCANRRRKKAQREREAQAVSRIATFEIEVDVPDEVGALAWGVACDPEVAAILHADSRRRAKSSRTFDL